MLPKGAVTISPAFKWAQSLDNVYLSIKFATRYDSPGCIDIFEKDVNITANRVDMITFCRIVYLIIT